MKRSRLVGGDVEAWNAVSRPQRALGLVLGLLLTAPLVIVGILLLLFVLTRLS